MTTKYTAYNLVKAISKLPRNRNYNYIATAGLIHIEDVELPAGPIKIRRWNPNKRETILSAKVESISQEMIWRIANAITEGEPFNFDRILGASYNTRSVLESLLASTPEFYYCYPGRIQEIDGHTSLKHGHKHLLWQPMNPHENGILTEKNVENMAIVEMPIRNIVYDSVVLPPEAINGDMDIEVARRHTQIQIALYLIGMALGYRTWIAQNDRSILYQGTPLMEHENVIPALQNETILSAFPHAEHNALLIDCIWFQNHHLMPAVFEVEHTTGITSGLTRMQNLYTSIPNLKTRYVIVAPDDDREEAIDKINRPQFRNIEARYFPYSSVEELFYICSHRNIRGITDAFLDSYMENVLVS